MNKYQKKVIKYMRKNYGLFLEESLIVQKIKLDTIQVKGILKDLEAEKFVTSKQSISGNTQYKLTSRGDEYYQKDEEGNRKIKIILTIVTIISLIIGIISGGQSIVNYFLGFGKSSSNEEIPYIHMKFANKTNDIIYIYKIGDFRLWAPDGSLEVGKYSIISTDDKNIKLEKDEVLDMKVDIHNDKKFKNYLLTEEFQADIVFRTIDDRCEYGRLMFIEEQIENYYLRVEFGNDK